MAYETITTRKEGPAYIITFNRPEKRNAISTVVMGEMMDAAGEIPVPQHLVSFIEALQDEADPDEGERKAG